MTDPVADRGDPRIVRVGRMAYKAYEEFNANAGHERGYRWRRLSNSWRAFWLDRVRSVVDGETASERHEAWLRAREQWSFRDGEIDEKNMTHPLHRNWSEVHEEERSRAEVLIDEVILAGAKALGLKSAKRR
jgi:hypothetical protein